MNQDICTICANTADRETWAKGIECHKDRGVHIGQCACGKRIGYMISNDFCEPTELICSDCLPKDRVSAKDANHTLYFFFIRTKRLFRDEVKTSLFKTFSHMADTLNAFTRTILGTLAVTFKLLSEVFSNLKTKCEEK